MSPLAPALATVVIVARALTSNRPSTGWLLIAAGQAFWSAGAFYYAIVLWYADPMPFPSLADASWLAFYLPTLAGIVLLIRARAAGRGETVSLLDAAIGGLAISAAGAALAFGPIVDATGGSYLAIATNLAFPLADLASSRSWSAAWRCPAGGSDAAGRCCWLGFVLFAVADTTYLFQIANGTYTGGLVDIGVGALLRGRGARRLAAVAGHACPGAGLERVRLPGRLRRDRAVRARLRPLPPRPRARARARDARVLSR